MHEVLSTFDVVPLVKDATDTVVTQTSRRSSVALKVMVQVLVDEVYGKTNRKRC